MHRLFALWRSRAKLAFYALFQYQPIAGAQEGEGEGGEGGAGAGGEGGGETAKTFTQAELDRIVQDRLARQAKQFEGFDDLKKKAGEFDKLQEAQLSELERERKAREKAETEASQRIEAANRRLIEAAVLAQATAQKAIKPEHMHRLIDTDKVTVGDDGQVTGAEDAVKAFLEANPEYVGKSTTPPGAADQGARKPAPNQLTREDLSRMSPEQIQKAVAEGRAASLLGA